MREIQQWVVNQNNKRELWGDHDTPESLTKQIAEEVKELSDAIKESFVTDDVFSVASEIGDVFYLMYKLCDVIGIDPDQATELKIIRNQYKYGDHTMSNGRDYKEAVEVSKNYWKAMGGDTAFSHAYLDWLAHE